MRASQAEMTVLSDLDFEGAMEGRAHPLIGKWVTVERLLPVHICFSTVSSVSRKVTEEQHVLGT